MSDDRKKWDARYRDADSAAPAAVEVLRENLHLLPRQGVALDLACGLGGNALLLASLGLEVHAWDISPIAINRVANSAAAHGLQLHAEAHDVKTSPPAAEAFDVIIVSYFLERALCSKLIAALKPNGLLFYQTFIQDKVNERGPSNPDFLLAPNELLQLCAPLQVLYYREEGRVGDTLQGFRDVAMLVGMKR